MAALNSGKHEEPFKYSSQVVQQAGGDQLQHDIIKIIQKKYLLTSEEEAVNILETFSQAIKNIVAKATKPVIGSPIPVMTCSSVSNTLSVTISDQPFNTKVETLPAGSITTEETVLPVLYGCHNVVTNLRTVMSGSVMQLYGLNLDIDKRDTEQGLYLIDFSGNATKIHTLVRVKATNIIFMIPSGLTANIYRLEIRKRIHSGEIIHTCLLPGFIRVII